MKSNGIIRFLWLAAIISGAIGILGHYDIVVIKYINNYNFELLLFAFIVLLVLRLFKK